MRFYLSDGGMTEAQKEFLESNLCRTVHGSEAHRLEVCQQLTQYCDLNDHAETCIAKELLHINPWNEYVSAGQFLYNGVTAANSNLYSSIQHTALAGLSAEDYPSRIAVKSIMFAGWALNTLFGYGG